MTCFSSDETVVFKFGNVDTDKVHDRYLLKIIFALLFSTRIPTVLSRKYKRQSVN